MRVQIIPSVEECLACPNCPAEGEAPCQKCIDCISNPDATGEVVQFLMYQDTAYAVILIDNEFCMADINNIRLIKE